MELVYHHHHQQRSNKRVKRSRNVISLINIPPEIILHIANYLRHNKFSVNPLIQSCLHFKNLMKWDEFFPTCKRLKHTFKEREIHIVTPTVTHVIIPHNQPMDIIKSMNKSVHYLEFILDLRVQVETFPDPLLDHLSIKFMCTLRNLNTLIINHRTLGLTDAKIIAQHLIEASSSLLQVLRLNHCQLGHHAVNRISGSLRNNSTLHTLDLGGNKIGEGCGNIAEDMKYNSTIQKLCLANNNIKLKGAISLAIYLNKNSTLQELDLSKNEICIDGVQILAWGLQDNSSLKKLNIEGNHAAFGRGVQIQQLGWTENLELKICAKK